MPSIPRLTAAGSVLLLGVALTGCGGPDQAGPERAVSAFGRAVSGSDGTAACSLLSDEVAASVGDPCAQAVLRQGLPRPAAIRSVQVYGRRALVTTATDTMFLSEFPGGWRIIGAGCTPRPKRPYDCVISGG